MKAAEDPDGRGESNWQPLLAETLGCQRYLGVSPNDAGQNY